MAQTRDDCLRHEGFARCLWTETDSYANYDNLLTGCYVAETLKAVDDRAGSLGQ